MPITLDGTLGITTPALTSTGGSNFATSSGNVGIGTATPYNNAGYGGVTLNGSTGGQLTFYTGGILKSSIFSDASNLSIYNTVSTGAVIIYTNSAEAIRIDGSGNVGINGAPSVKFQVGAGGTAASTNWSWFPSNSLNPPAANTYGLMIGGNLSSGSSSTNLVWGQGIGSTQHLAIGKWTGSTYTEQMRIDSSNNVMVGTTTAFGKFGVVSGSTYFGVAPATYMSAQFGPRPANDATCSVLFNYGSSSGDFWKIDSSAAGFYFAQQIGATGYVPLTVSSSGYATLYGTSTGSTYLNLANGSSGGRSYALFSTGTAWGGGLPAGYFGVYDNTVNATRLSIDTGGNVTIAQGLTVGNNVTASGFVGYGAFYTYFTANINANANTAPAVIGSYASGATNAPDNSGILWNGMSGTNGAGDGGQFWQNYSNNAVYNRKRWGGGYGAWVYVGG